MEVERYLLESPYLPRVGETMSVEDFFPTLSKQYEDGEIQIEPYGSITDITWFKDHIDLTLDITPKE
jgi:hypothetical protein